MNFKKITTLAVAGTFAFGMAAATTSVEAAHQEEPPKIEQPAPELHNDKQDVDSRVDPMQQPVMDVDTKDQEKAPGLKIEVEEKAPQAVDAQDKQDVQGQPAVEAPVAPQPDMIQPGMDQKNLPAPEQNDEHQDLQPAPIADIK